MLSICRRTVHSDPFLQVFTFWEFDRCSQITGALLGQVSTALIKAVSVALE